MRVIMHKYIAVGDKYDVDISQLPIKEMLGAGLRARYMKSKAYQRKLEKERTAEREKRQRDIEDLKKGLMYRIQHSLVNNQNLDEDLLIKEIEVKVNRRFDYILDLVCKEKEFLAYTITRKTENPDMLLAFPDLEICLVISKRVITSGIYANK